MKRFLVMLFVAFMATGGFLSAKVIKHAMGSTDIPDNPKKVVILTNEGTEALIALGFKPVGAVQSWTGNPWYEHIKGKMDGVKVLGVEHKVNLEAVASLEPDLIIGNKFRQEKIYSQLSMIAPTVMSTTLRGAWQDNFRFYAKVLGLESNGEALLNNFYDRIKQVGNKAGDKLNRKISVVRFLPGSTRVYMKNSFSGVILDRIGFARTVAQDSDKFAEVITKEQLPTMADGDVIFYFTYDKGDGKGLAKEKEWLNDGFMKSLNAVKNGKVFKISDTIWNTSGGLLSANLMLDDLYYFLDRM